MENIEKVILDINSNYGEPKDPNNRITLNFISNFEVLDKVIEILQNEASVLTINIGPTEYDHFVIVGDIHGDIRSLIDIFKLEGDPSTTKYLFLGDYVDRGNNGTEVLFLLYAYKCLYPNNIFLIRGNHEFISMNETYGFKSECEQGYPDYKQFHSKIAETFKYLPLCAILNDKIFCVHGGISNLIENRDQLMKICKVGDKLTSLHIIQEHLLWSDPNPKIPYFAESPRNIGLHFGKSALDDFLKNLNFDLVIRAHENELNGFSKPFGPNGGIYTIFSSTNYCETGNEGAIVKFSKNGKPYCIRVKMIGIYLKSKK